MAGVRTIDHAGFMTDDLVRGEKFYSRFFGAEVLFRTSLSTSDRKKGYVPVTFVNMGGHRYELFWGMDEFLPPNESLVSVPRIGFEVTEAELRRAVKVFGEAGVPVSEPMDSTGPGDVECAVRFLDPDGNALELCVRGKDGAPVPESPGEGPLRIGRMSHVVLESTDLGSAEAFCVKAMGMRSLGRDRSETGRERLIVRAEAGQLLAFELVDRLSPRSLYRSGNDSAIVPDAVPGTPYRYKGAHTAVAVGGLEDFHHLQASINEFGGLDEGDHRAALRAPGELSTYFYDPSGNRFQAIIIAEA